ncbi:hypothetical protein PWT90_04608 [Aphanocladium album]|nr:hypothetical protein PWT90_04608 [Aphanocladium album]
MPRRRGSGCMTCRIRRVKCDEGKPHCRRCLSTGRRCDGYAAPSSNASRRELAALSQQGRDRLCDQTTLQLYALTQAPAAAAPGRQAGSVALAREYRLFDRFRAVAAQSTALWMNSQFWSGEVLPRAHDQPVIWQGCLALAALNWAWEGRTAYRRPKPGLEGAPEQDRAPALLEEAGTYYRNSMQLARDMRDPAQALVLALVLSTTTSMMGRLGESRLHLAAGRRILHELGPAKNARRAAETLVRLDFDAMSVGDLSAPYEPLDLPQLRYGAASIDCVTDYEQALDYMHRMVRGCMLFAEIAPGPKRSEQETHLLAHLRQWEVQVARLERGTASTLTTCSRHYPQMLMVRIYHSLMLVSLVMAQAGSEMRYDNHTHIYIRLVLLIEELIRHSKRTAQSSAMEAGLVAWLFVAVLRCRHPWTRRRALKILENLDRQEGLWRSDAAAAALRRLVAMEEGEAAGALPSFHARTQHPAQNSAPDVDTAGADGEFYLGEPLRDWLHREIRCPWEHWSTPEAVMSPDRHWEDIVRIPEHCRVKGVQTSILPTEQRLRMSVFMCSELEKACPVFKHEIDVPF